MIAPLRDHCERMAAMALENAFDPVGDLPTVSFAKPSHLSALNLRVLSPFHRALLVIDGTVTKFIEAYTMEPVEVIRLGQGPSPTVEEHRWLDLAGLTDVAIRQVLIRGAYSRTLYVFAVSYVVPARLPDGVRGRLDRPSEGLGRILEDEGIETRREILWFGRERGVEVPGHEDTENGSEFISRAYRIITAGRPIALINERFPVRSDPFSSLG